MPDQVNADKAEERVSSESGLLLSVEPLGGRPLSALGDADTDTTDTTGDDTDSGLGDTDTTDAGDADGSDSLLGDADASDTDASDADASDSDEADGDGTDGGDDTESESGLPGENPLGLNRPERVRNGDDKDTRDT